MNEGKGHNGGVWEWTSTVFDKYEGFLPSKLGMTSIGSFRSLSSLTDFFDGDHQVVVRFLLGVRAPFSPI